MTPWHPPSPGQGGEPSTSRPGAIPRTPLWTGGGGGGTQVGWGGGAGSHPHAWQCHRRHQRRPNSGAEAPLAQGMNTRAASSPPPPPPRCGSCAAQGKVPLEMGQPNGCPQVALAAHPALAQQLAGKALLCHLPGPAGGLALRGPTDMSVVLTTASRSKPSGHAGGLAPDNRKGRNAALPSLLPPPQACASRLGPQAAATWV